MKRSIAAILMSISLLALAGCGGKSQEYVNAYKQGYQLGSSLTAGGQSEANLICGPNVAGQDKDTSDGYMAGCTDAATGQQDAYP